MANWNEGYVTDIEYTDKFYARLSPQHLALATMIGGFEPPNLSRRFTYCELGCGKGMTSLILAAANANAEFHAVDFNPAHIAHAEEQAQAAQLENITFHERSFEDLTGPNAPALPMFDIVTMHGVWSWISAEMQTAILKFLNNRLKPGGLVYVSYNALPSRSVIAPVQRVLKEISLMLPGSSDATAAAAFKMLERLSQEKIVPAQLYDAFKEVVGAELDLPYFAHEYLNEHWKPLYHADVARAFASAKLTFTGSAEILRNFLNIVLSDRQRTLLAEIPTPEVRETLKDFATGAGFRVDIFMRGARQIPEARRDALLRGLQLAAVRPPPESIEIPGPDQTLWRAHPAYRSFTSALQTRPHSVAELLALPGLPPGHGVSPLELVGVLVGGGHALLYANADAASQAACMRFNRLIEAEREIPFSRTAYIAVATLKTAFTLESGDFDLYMALRRGERPSPKVLASQFMQRCRVAGGVPTVDGKSLPVLSEALEALTRDYAMKIDTLVPLWGRAGVVEASS